MNQPNVAPPNFDPIARIYRWAEYLALGPILQRTRTHFLPQLTDRHRALAIGDGDGRFLARLLTQNRGLQAVAVDTSCKMLNLLGNRCHAAKDNDVTRLRTWKGSALEIRPAKDTDLIITHFFLDCLTQTQVNTLTQTLATATRPGTLWLLSDFQIPRSPLAPLARLYIRSLYLAFRLLTNLRITHLPNPQSALAAAGFTRIAHHQRLFGVIYTEIWRHD